MSAPAFSIVTYCKGRLAHLERALPTFVQQPDTEVVVVDYDCPDRARDFLAARYPGVVVATVDAAPVFNLSHARNVGAAAARAPWLAFCDADMLLVPAFMAEMRRRLAPGTYLRPFVETPQGPRRVMFPMLCEAAALARAGGYDDVFRGWGGADREFLRRLELTGARETLYPAALVETLQHTNESRRSHYEHPIDVSMVVNHHYARIKERFFATRGAWFADAQRRSTYAQVERAVLASLGEPGRDAVFDIAIPDCVPPWTARVAAASVRSFHAGVVGGLHRLEE